MSNKAPKLPNPKAVKELRELYNKRKEESFKKHKELGEILKKRAPLKKIAMANEFSAVEI